MRRQLFRSRKYKMLGGVAGGIAEYFDIDPVIVRALFIIATFGWGVSILIYIILWIIVPAEELVFKCNNEPEMTEQEASMISSRKTGTRLLFGALLIVTGVFLLISNFIPWISFHSLWPVALILFGGYILYRTYQNNNMRNGNEIG